MKGNAEGEEKGEVGGGRMGGFRLVSVIKSALSKLLCRLVANRYRKYH